MPNYVHDSADVLAKTNLDTTLGALGFSALVATTVCLFSFIPEIANSHLNPFAIRMVCGAAAFAAYLVILFFADFFQGQRGRIVVLALSVLGLVAMLLVLFLSFPAWFMYGLFAVIGFSVACCAAMWFVYICMEAPRSTMSYVALGFAGGLLLCGVESFLPDVPQRVSMIIVMLVCICFLPITGIKDVSNSQILSVTGKESDRRSKIQRSSVVMLAVNYFQFGMVCALVKGHAYFLCLLCCFAVVVVVLVDSMTKRRLNERTLYPFATPICVLVLTSLYLYSSEVTTVLLCLLSMLFSFYLLSGYAALARHVRFSRLSPVREISKARLTNVAGLVLGLFVGSVLDYFFASGNVAASVRISVLLGILYVVVANTCHKVRFPDTSSVVDASTSPSESEAKGQWKKRCMIIAEKYHLSDRQYEVLRLISQGRNAEYVSQHLTISINTVQTHIRNIYQKTGVHSRQELLDMIESTKLYGED